MSQVRIDVRDLNVGEAARVFGGELHAPAPLAARSAAPLAPNGASVRRTWWARGLRVARDAAIAVAIMALVPIGFGIWLAHYSFHFLTGLYTFIPVTQSAFADFGWAILGQPHWSSPGLPPNIVQLFEFGFITLGLLGSLLVSYSIAVTEEVVHPVRVFIPWATLALVMAGAAFWLLSQPMEMRGIVLGGG